MTTYSDLPRLLYDSRDYGFKTWSAVGSIPAASHTLTLTSVPADLANGDTIIIETGGETGAGARGTIGVGGQWPATTYANAAARVAATPATNTYAGQLDTGDVYLWNGAVWTLVDGFYVTKIVPKALVTTITGVSGSIITVADASVAAATNANVYFDNAPNFNARFGNSSTWIAGLTAGASDFVFSGDTFAFGSPLEAYGPGINRWKFFGWGKDATTLFSPKGTPTFSLMFINVNNTCVYDLGIKGNFRQQGYCLVFPSGAGVIVGSVAYAQGMCFANSSNCDIWRCKATDIARTSFGSSQSNSVWAYECDVVLTDAFREYVQWQYEWADGIGGGAVDCTMTAPYATPGFEGFRCTGVQFIRPRSTNGTFSMNSVGNFLIDSPYLIMTPNSQFDEESFSHRNPLINISSNIQPPDATISLGGIVRNPTIIQIGAMNASGQAYSAIVVNANNPNVQVLATYPSEPNPQGYIELPNQTNVADGLDQGAGIAATGDNFIMDGIRVVAPMNADVNQAIQYYNGTGGIIRNSIYDSIYAPPDNATLSNNQTNAQWKAATLAAISPDELTALLAELDVDLPDNAERRITAATLRALLRNILTDAAN